MDQVHSRASSTESIEIGYDNTLLSYNTLQSEDYNILIFNYQQLQWAGVI